MSDILILGTSDDPHVARVVAALEREEELSCTLLDHLRSETSFSVHEDGRYALVVDGTRVEAPAVVWDRQKYRRNMTFRFKDRDEQTARWRTHEWTAFCKLVAGVFGRSLLNSLESRACLVKPYQQIVASAAGLRVPETLITNRKAPILDFVSGTSSIIKSLSEKALEPEEPHTGASRTIMTMPLDSSAVERAVPAQFALAPQLIQRCIQKRHELRVVVVDQEIFAFRIDSQASAVATTDWRHGIGLVAFEPCAVSDSIAASLRRFMRVTGLFSGSFDLVVDRDDSTWFLECNQDGQWGWLDDLVNGDIARSFARAFAMKARARVLSDQFARAL